MAKKIKIDIDFNQDNSLVGISCHKKDYWIAFQLNDLLHINLRRLDDLCVYKSQQDLQLSYPLFHYTDTDSLINYYFFSNHNQEGKLFPAQKTIDYFLLINGLIAENKLQQLVSAIRNRPGVIAAYNLDLKKIKNYEDFLTDLELYMMEIMQSKK
ncbi:MAG: IPExxxVDY family protein [Bacteroidales bacterium]|nr:IPExxxVDY family protein [Bacteroidales bacterium]